MPELKKELGFFDIFCLGFGAMVSSGLFVLPGIAFEMVGPGVFISYFLAALLLAPALLCTAELASAMPKAGGDYFYIDRSLGPAFGTLAGIAGWTSLAFKTAFALLGIGAFARLIWPDLTLLQMRLIALGFCMLFMLLNLWGTKEASLFQVWLVIVLLAILAGYVVLGVGQVQAVNYARMLPYGWGALPAGAAMVSISFAGVTKIGSAGEEAKNPGRNLPLGMISSFVLASLFSVAVVFVTVGVVSKEELAGSLTPLSLGGKRLWPGGGAATMAIAAILAFLTTGNAGILAAARSLMAMSRDKRLPEPLGRINRSRGTPHYAILLTSALIGAILFLEIKVFVKTASASFILVYALDVISVMLMRESRLANYKPRFHSPGYPWLHIAGLLTYCFLLVELGTFPLLITGAFLGAGFMWYALYAGVHLARESALTYLARRIADRAFSDHDLEMELAEIVRERDSAGEDRFDSIVRTCEILDLPEATSREKLFNLIAEKLSHHLCMSPEKVRDLLEKREQSYSTVIRPGLAIPHVVVDGSRLFDMLVVRCRKGIAFLPDKPPVHAVFVLIGSRDERNMHVRALMALAEITQKHSFDRKWHNASDTEALRQILLTANRRRDSTTLSPRSSESLSS